MTNHIPEPFDLTAWLDGAQLPQRAVRVVGRADLIAVYQQLDARLAAARATATGGMLVSRADERRLAEEMTAVRAAIEASTIELRFRALTAEEWADIDATVPPQGDPGHGEARAAAGIAAACTSHSMTREQAALLRIKIGEGQYRALWDAVWATSNETQVEVPFSLAHSAALTRTDT
jgi:hypothetical protein